MVQKGAAMPEAQPDPEELVARAVKTLLGDPALRGELTDEEAELLINWGVAQATRLARQAAETVTPDMLEEALANLRRLMMRVNRLVRLRTEGDPDQVRGELERLTALGERLYGGGQQVLLDDTEKEAFLVEQAALDNRQVIARVLGMLAPPVDSSPPQPPDSQDVPAILPAPEQVQSLSSGEAGPPPGLLSAGTIPPALPDVSGDADPFSPPEAYED